VGIAENQRANAGMVAQSGAGLVAGFLTGQSRAEVAAALTRHLDEISADAGLRRRMSRAAVSLCDGRGTQRVVIALVPGQVLPDGRTLRLRPCEKQHESLLLDWQSAPETRRFALNPRAPSLVEHHAWLAAKLASDQDWPLLGAVEGEPAGHVRLDWSGEDRGRPQYLVSIVTAPGWYRLGIGRALLAGIRALAPGAHFLAKVLPDNLASVALFRKAGYSLAADGYFHSLPPQRKED
jgi:ribosomal protein S18 acetylase RimI-like enzyme